MNFDWSELAFGNKKPLKELKATFIAAPREISSQRFAQLLKNYLAKGNVVLGLAKERYVEGFEDQPQFKMLDEQSVRQLINLTNRRSPGGRKVYLLHYFQRELPYILEKIDFRKVCFVRGSWRHVFHTHPVYYILMGKGASYELVSPFVDEDEARAYEKGIGRSLVTWVLKQKDGPFSEKAIMGLVNKIATFSYDYSFQTGAMLARPTGGKKGEYQPLTAAFNKVVPFQTYAMHYGAAREVNFSSSHDLNHYDTIHAEMALLLSAHKKHIDLKGSSLFINLMPCPFCTRTLMETDIQEIVYSVDHSDGYAVRMLEAAGKKVRRIVV